MNEQHIKQKGLLWTLANARALKQGIPKSIKRLGRKLLPLESYDAQRWLAEDPYSAVEQTSSYEGKADVCLGIIKEFTRVHSHYIGACRALGIPYKVLDMSGPDWMEVIRRSQCDALLVRPSGEISAWKQMFDERLRIVSHELGKTIFPSYDEIWFYESKRRMYYWLGANDIPHPKTWVYYDRHEALAFADATPLPIVFKADFGSGALGIQIFRERGKLIRWINRYFKKGCVNRGADSRDRQWGSVLFQAYLPKVTEWRMIRIGASYMGYQKVKRGNFASGARQFKYVCPPDALLEFVRRVTCRGGFQSMAVDIFETEDGRYLVNEFQTTFGLHVEDGLPMKEGPPGRFLFDNETHAWRFEAGLFCQNKLCNLRVQTLMEQLKGGLEGHNTTAESDRFDDV
jgi:glutathione synthase/RimK-type ligase-like ATP-grasp enzyme